MNEEELEKIAPIEARLAKKKKLTAYEQGQLDLIAALRSRPKRSWKLPSLKWKTKRDSLSKAKN